jgi:cardiolipin synthase
VIALELLVGSDAFWARASADIRGARRRVHVQAMTFEGDIAGGKVAAAITASAAADRRVLVDDYSRFTVSDRSVNSLAGRFDSDLKAEVRATDAMFRGLIRAGAPVRLTNPIGRLMANYPARNHKKLIIADDVAYIGGINFSDHNFAWLDFMLRLEGAAAADLLAGDFAATFEGRPRPWSADVADITLISLDGRANAAEWHDRRTHSLGRLVFPAQREH